MHNSGYAPVIPEGGLFKVAASSLNTSVVFVLYIPKRLMWVFVAKWNMAAINLEPVD